MESFGGGDFHFAVSMGYDKREFDVKKLFSCAKIYFVILSIILLCLITFCSIVKDVEKIIEKNYLQTIQPQGEIFCIKKYDSLENDLFDNSIVFCSGGNVLVFSNKEVNNLLGAENMEEELGENIDKQLDDIDFDILDNQIDNLDLSEKDFVGKKSFLELVKSFISGENDSIYNDFIPYALGTLFDFVLEYVPYFAVIIAVIIGYSLLSNVTDDGGGVERIVYIACFGTVATIVLKLIIDVLHSSSQAIGLMQTQMEAIFPILLTLMTAIGGVVSASTFQPFMAVLSSGISKMFSSIMVPVFIFSIVFCTIGAISKNVKLEKFSKFFTSLFSWVVGVVFTVFIAFLSVSGLTSATADSISLKTAKFAIKSYVPMVGGYLSDGMSVIVCSSVLVKNAIGISGLVLLVATVFAPIIKIGILILLLKLTSAILEPLCDKELPDFLFAVSKTLNMLVVCLLAVGVMYLISISLVMCCANAL